MKRPNIYSKPLAGERKENYHPADYSNNQYADDLNKYIDYLESKVKNLSSKPVLADSKPRNCPKCNSTNVIIFDSDNDLCNDCGAYFC